MTTRQIRRGDIFWINFGETKGSEQGGVRPAVIVQNDVGNKYSPTVIVAIITSEIKKKELPTHVILEEYSKYGLKQRSQVMAEQMKVRDKTQLGDYIGTIDTKVMDKIDKAIEVSVNVGSAKNITENREVKSIKVKVEKIRTLDSFIVEEFFTTRERDMSVIEELIRERESRLEDLKRFATLYNINYREYYNPMVYSNLERMVG